MYIIDKDGKLIEGDPISDTEREFAEEFHVKVNTSGRIYLTPDEARAAAAYVIRHYELTKRKSAEPEPLEDEVLPDPLPLPNSVDDLPL